MITMRGLFYILDNLRQPIRCDDAAVWGAWFHNIDNRIVDRTVIGNVKVSTVFIGLDHRFNKRGPPILFETMLFGGKYDGELVDRYSSWSDAEAGHAMAVKRIKVEVETPKHFDDDLDKPR